MEDKKDKITLDASDRVDEKGRRYEDLRNDLKDDENYDKACEDTMEFVYQERQKKPLNIPFYEKEPPKKILKHSLLRIFLQKKLRRVVFRG